MCSHPDPQGPGERARGRSPRTSAVYAGWRRRALRTPRQSELRWEGGALGSRSPGRGWRVGGLTPVHHQPCCPWLAEGTPPWGPALLRPFPATPAPWWSESQGRRREVKSSETCFSGQRHQAPGAYGQVLPRQMVPKPRERGCTLDFRGRSIPSPTPDAEVPVWTGGALPRDPGHRPSQ